MMILPLLLSLVTVSVPENAPFEKTLCVQHEDNHFLEISPDDHRESYEQLEKIGQVWNTREMHNYLIYGEGHHETFKWIMVPYPESSILHHWLLNHFRVYSYFFFGDQGKLLPNIDLMQIDLPQKEEEEEGDDPFCRKEIIEMQTVFEGDLMRVLFNYNPIDLDGKERHFLIIPKKHRKDFTSLTREEYQESMRIAQAMIELYEPMESYLFHKKGRDAGQSVEHWHLHVVLSDIPTRTFRERLYALSKMVFRLNRLDEKHLKESVMYFRQELEDLLEQQEPQEA